VPLRFVRPTAAQRYATCLPLIPLQAAAGAFGDPQRIPEDLEWEQWGAVDLGRKLRRGMFVAQVVGKSMEPPIPDGSYCVFAGPWVLKKATKACCSAHSDASSSRRP
jgi:hypothetical protein